MLEKKKASQTATIATMDNQTMIFKDRVVYLYDKKRCGGGDEH
jgi:hypothetical protein